MTPDARIRVSVAGLSASGRWCGMSLDERVALFVESTEVVVRAEQSGVEYAASFDEMSGAAWRAGALSLYRAGEELQLQGGEGLDRVWFTLSRRACALPEVARALRALGAAHGATAADHGRFVAPFLQARRRLEGEEPMDWLVASFDTGALAERTRAQLAAMALERHADRPPHRRALEARLLDACEALFQAIERVGDLASLLHSSGDGQRFEAWRQWASAVRALFAQTDRAWREVAAHLAAADADLTARARR